MLKYYYTTFNCRAQHIAELCCAVRGCSLGWGLIILSISAVLLRGVVQPRTGANANVVRARLWKGPAGVDDVVTNQAKPAPRLAHSVKEK